MSTLQTQLFEEATLLGFAHRFEAEGCRIFRTTPRLVSISRQSSGCGSSSNFYTAVSQLPIGNSRAHSFRRCRFGQLTSLRVARPCRKERLKTNASIGGTRIFRGLHIFENFCYSCHCIYRSFRSKHKTCEYMNCRVSIAPCLATHAEGIRRKRSIRFLASLLSLTRYFRMSIGISRLIAASLRDRHQCGNIRERSIYQRHVPFDL